MDGEIAGILGRSVGVSQSQLHKARKCLRELLH
jgi:DNA-directed RNA polymerase specialized sigma24 family protein